VTILFGPEAPRLARGGFAFSKTMTDATPRGWLGFTADGVQRNWMEADGLYVQHLEYPTVVEVDPDSPAAKVGVKFGDVLLAYDGADLRRNTINLTRLLAPGRTVSVKLRRDGESKDFSIVVEKAPPTLLAERRAAAVGRILVPSRTPMADTLERRLVEAQASVAMAGARGGGGALRATRAPSAMVGAMPRGYLGAAMTDLDPAALAFVSGDKATNGVFVSAVPSGSPAARMGLLGGDLIVGIGDVPVLSMGQLYRELASRGADRVTQFSVLRKGKIEKLTYEPR
jgi:S1-C subfamily serine protease